jgi:acid phosphatase type 7
VTTYHARVVVVSSVGSVASADSVFTTLADSAAVRVAAAGDIACDPTDPSFNGGAGTPAECQQKAVADAILARSYNAVLPLGDEQYNNGTASQFAASYNPSWGRFKAISHPAIGNHEYGTPTLAYFQYFGAAAGDPGKGYYSYDLGSWHVLVINSNCSFIGGCNPGSPQENWVRADLAAHRVSCTLAYFHHPRFSSGQAGDDLEMSSIWSDLVGSGVDLVLTGHDHEYERFAPQDASGGRDDARGAREFVVGTGGMNHMTFKAAIQPNSEVRNNTSFGFLDLSLGTGSYSWRFVSVPPGGFSDSGSASCH